MAKNSTTNTSNGKKKNDKFAKLVGPVDAKIDTEARERLITARIGLLMRHPFFGNLVTRLKLVNADEWLSTAATDGLNLYYNSRFVMLLKTKEVEFLLAHEILHCVYSHLDRKEHRNAQLYNVACDYAVNADLKRHRVGEFITSVPCLFDQKYDGMSSEQIYDDLMKNVQYISVNDLVDQMIDEHMDDDEGDGESDNDDNKEGKGKRPTPMTAEEREKMRQELKQAIINAAQTSEPGSVPAGVERLINSITSPKMPWRELLQTSFTSIVKADFSFMRPSRRSWHMDAILPSQLPGESISIAVAIDMSGSISEKEGALFLSEVAGMMEMFEAYSIYVMCFDTEIYNPQLFTSDDAENIGNYKLMGGGGTAFGCIFNHLKNEGIVPDRLVLFTDLYTCDYGDPEYCDTLFIVKGNPNGTAPYGITAQYDD